MQARWIALVSLALCACSVKPDGSNGIRRDFSVPGASYEQVYRHALDFARTCHTGGGIFKHATVTSEIYQESMQAYVHVAWGGGPMPEQMNIQGHEVGTLVSIVALGGGMWDERELDAAQRSIESGAPSCR